MAKHKTSDGTEKKTRSKKRNSRLEVSDSDSESDGGTEIRRDREEKVVEETKAHPTTAESPSTPAKKDKKEKKVKKAKKEKKTSKHPTTNEPESPTSHIPASTARSSMTASINSPPPPKPTPKKKSTSSTPSQRALDPLTSTPQSTLDAQFSAIYLRTLTAEFADDLDKVRSAPDFKENSVAMLVHALKQGEALFSEEEKRRVVEGGGADG